MFGEEACRESEALVTESVAVLPVHHGVHLQEEVIVGGELEFGDVDTEAVPEGSAEAVLRHQVVLRHGKPRCERVFDSLRRDPDLADDRFDTGQACTIVKPRRRKGVTQVLFSKVITPLHGVFGWC